MKKLQKSKAVLAIVLTLLAPGVLVVGVGCSGGCSIFKGAAVAEGSDPIVVHAQRAQNYALDTFNEFLLFEKENRALLNDPAIKAAADNIRANYKQWDDDLSVAIKAYQLARTQENANRMDMALSVLHQAIAIARHYIVTKSVTLTK